MIPGTSWCDTCDWITCHTPCRCCTRNVRTVFPVNFAPALVLNEKSHGAVSATESRASTMASRAVGVTDSDSSAEYDATYPGRSAS